MQPLRTFTRGEWLTFGLIALLYVLMIGHYRTFNIDDPWFANYTYSWWHGHDPVDPLMQRRFPNGMGGVEAFGKLAASIQSIVMDRVGWRLLNFQWLSTAFFAGTLLLLADFARRMGRSPLFVMSYLTVMGASEPFVAAAGQARYEFLTMLLFSLALWSGARKQILLSAFLGALCMEIQPAGCIPFLATAAFLLSQQDARAMKQRGLRVVLGAALAASVYLLFHPNILFTMQHAEWAAVKHAMPFGGFFVGWFRESHRHLIDLAVLVVAVAIAFRYRRNVLQQWPAIALALAIVASAVLRWDNEHYFALLMPFVAWLLVDAFSERNWKWLVAATLLLYLPQYAYRYAFSVRHPNISSAETQQVTDALVRVAERMGKRPEELKVRGNTYLWFTHPQNYTALDLRTFLSGQSQTADVVLCFDRKLEPLFKERSPEITCAQLQSLPAAAETLSMQGTQLHVVPLAGMDLHYQPQLLNR